MSAAPAQRAGRVVVGVDGSDDSAAALRAAADVASLLHAPLAVVTTWLQPAGFGRAPLRLPDFPRETEAVQAALVDSVLGDRPPVELHRIVRAGGPGPALVEESADARLLVVGRRGHGGFAELLLGSAAMSAVVRAHCSVLVLAHRTGTPVPEDARGPGARRVVVGVDGDAPSLTALAVALRAAEALDARLDVVTAWTVWAGHAEPLDDLRDVVESSARSRQDAAIEQVVPADRRGRVHPVLREGSTSAVLVAEGEDADLLVVGVRSRSAVVEVFTGAVALTTAAHARCPVLVVRGDPGAPESAAGEATRDASDAQD